LKNEINFPNSSPGTEMGFSIFFRFEQSKVITCPESTFTKLTAKFCAHLSKVDTIGLLFVRRI